MRPRAAAAAALTVLAGCGGSPARQAATSVEQGDNNAGRTTTATSTSTRPIPLHARPARALVGTKRSSTALCALLPAAKAAAIIHPTALALGGGGQPDHLRAIPLKPYQRGQLAASGCEYKALYEDWLFVYVTRGLPETSADPALPPTLSRFVLGGHKAVYSPGTGNTPGFLHVSLPAKAVLDIEPRFGNSKVRPSELDPELKPFAQRIAMAILAEGGL